MAQVVHCSWIGGGELNTGESAVNRERMPFDSSSSTEPGRRTILLRVLALLVICLGAMHLHASREGKELDYSQVALISISDFTREGGLLSRLAFFKSNREVRVVLVANEEELNRLRRKMGWKQVRAESPGAFALADGRIYATRSAQIDDLMRALAIP